MEIRKYGEKKILIADENKHIRDIDDVYTPATETEEEHNPYYASIIIFSSSLSNALNSALSILTSLFFIVSS